MKKFLTKCFIFAIIIVLLTFLHYHYTVTKRLQAYQEINKICELYGGSAYQDRENVLCIHVGNEFDDKGLIKLARRIKNIPKSNTIINDYVALDIDLSSTQITDHGFSYLEGISIIEQININETKLTNASIPTIKSFFSTPIVRILMLINTEITQEGEEDIKNFLTTNKCMVIYNGEYL